MRKTERVGVQKLKSILCVGMLVLFAGCDQKPPVATAAETAVSSKEPSGAESVPSAGPEVLVAQPAATAKLAEGMAYADLRKLVLDKGWKPKVDAQCKANVVGANFDELCKSNPDQCQVCDKVPELSSCSGDGHCLMNFERGNGEALAVSTYGEIADWNVSGKDSRLTVKWWDPQSIDAPTGK